MNWTIYGMERPGVPEKSLCGAAGPGRPHSSGPGDGAKDFKTGFLYSYGLCMLENWYDCFFLDWVLIAVVR